MYQTEELPDCLPLRTAMSWQLMGVDGDGMKSIPDILLCTSLTSLCPGREEIWEEDQLDATLSTDLASVLFTQCSTTEFWLIPSLSESSKLTEVQVMGLQDDPAKLWLRWQLMKWSLQETEKMKLHFSAKSLSWERAERRNFELGLGRKPRFGT